MQNFINEGSINVNGDFNVSDHSKSEYKLLVHCTNEELLQERPYRQENIRIEQTKKVTRLKPLYALTACLFVAAAIWASIIGNSYMDASRRSSNFTR